MGRALSGWGCQQRPNSSSLSEQGLVVSLGTAEGAKISPLFGGCVLFTTVGVGSEDGLVEGFTTGAGACVVAGGTYVADGVPPAGADGVGVADHVGTVPPPPGLFSPLTWGSCDEIFGAFVVGVADVEGLVEVEGLVVGVADVEGFDEVDGLVVGLVE
ncbi:hypothetical protein B7Z17_04460, partial [Candidatus Saccharibacteria bacterium 32-49-10]